MDAWNSYSLNGQSAIFFMNLGFIEIYIGYKAVIYSCHHIYRLFRDLMLNGPEEFIEDALPLCLLPLNLIRYYIIIPSNSDCE
jgi:hypothetical protein